MCTGTSPWGRTCGLGRVFEMKNKFRASHPSRRSVLEAPSKNICGWVMPNRHTCGLSIRTGSASRSFFGTRCLPFQRLFAQLHNSRSAGLSDWRGEPKVLAFETLAKKCPASSMSMAKRGLRLSAYSTAESLVTWPSRSPDASHASSARATALSAWSLPQDV